MIKEVELARQNREGDPRTTCLMIGVVTSLAGFCVFGLSYYHMWWLCLNCKILA
jgi:hypothetical protein